MVARLTAWLADCLPADGPAELAGRAMAACSASHLAPGRLVGGSPARLIVWLDGRPAGWPFGWLVALLAGRLVGWLPCGMAARVGPPTRGLMAGSDLKAGKKGYLGERWPVVDKRR